MQLNPNKNHLLLYTHINLKITQIYIVVCTDSLVCKQLFSYCKGIQGDFGFRIPTVAVTLHSVWMKRKTIVKIICIQTTV